MGMKHLWDTNTVIYYLQQQFPSNAEKFIDDLLKDEQPVISAITEIELLCWKTATEKDLKILQSFLNDAFIIELEQPVKLKAAAIRATSRIKLPDAVIAATAIVYDLTLLTRNTIDFVNIAELKIENPWEK